MRVVKALFWVTVFTTASAGVPRRDIIKDTAEDVPFKEINEKSIREDEETIEKDSLELNNEDSTLESKAAPKVTSTSPKDDVISISHILGELPDRKDNLKTRSGKYIVKDTSTDSNTNIDITTKTPDNLHSSSRGYEITENVIDVPDDRTVAGPIIYNYTKYTPLNLGGVLNKPETTTPEPEEVEDDKTVRSRVSILHIKAELDEPVKRDNKIKTFFNGVKKYITGIKTGVVNGIHKLFGKKENDSHDKSFDADVASDEDANISNEDDEFPDLHKHDDDFSTLHKNDDDFGELHKNIHDDIHGFFN